MKDQLVEVMDKALGTAFGLVLKAKHYHAARQLRRRLYAVRERLRKEENNRFDALSFIVKLDGELWLVRRDMITQAQGKELACRPILREELPERILARGKSKPGLLTRFLLDQLGKKP
jgi:hypothetical protein